jgi:hypothetical protein
MDWFHAYPSEKITKSSRLYPKDKDCLVTMSKLLVPLKEATLLFSQKKVPLLPDTLSCFHILQDHCDRMEEEEESVIAAAAQRMSATIRKYYELTDDCELYRMAIRE